MKILEFKREYYFLSNFYPTLVRFGGIEYLSSEAAFQSMKCINPKDRYKFSDLNPSDAKRLGRSIEIRKDWEDIKEDIMYKVCFAKFSQHKVLRTKLVETYPAILEEGNDWNDTEWGICNGVGENKLGKILMKLRDEFIKLSTNDTAVYFYFGDEFNV